MRTIVGSQNRNEYEGTLYERAISLQCTGCQAVRATASLYDEVFFAGSRLPSRSQPVGWFRATNLTTGGNIFASPDHLVLHAITSVVPSISGPLTPYVSPRVGRNGQCAHVDWPIDVSDGICGGINGCGPITRVTKFSCRPQSLLVDPSSTIGPVFRLVPSMETLLTRAVNRILSRFIKSAGGDAGSELRATLSR